MERIECPICGKTGSVCYGNRCEDCYLDAIPFLEYNAPYTEVRPNADEIGGYVRQGLPLDRHWNRPKGFPR